MPLSVPSLPGRTPFQVLFYTASCRSHSSLTIMRASPEVEQLMKCPMCDQLFTDPRTLPCLHSFCLVCLESQKATADLRCHQCRAPFTSPALGGIGEYACNAFISSLVKPAKAIEGDVNRMVKCEGCDEENGTMHCADCGQNMGPVCVASHRRLKVTSSHQLIPLHDALKGKVEVKRIPRCLQHVGSEIDTYCKTCNDAICARCILASHKGHDVCLLEEMTSPLRDQVAGYTITITRREGEARKAISTLDGTIDKIEEHRNTAEEDIATFVSTLYAAVDARAAVLVSEMQDKGDQLRKTVVKEKGEAESAAGEFREFHSFTEGLLAQGTPPRNCWDP